VSRFRIDPLTLHEDACRWSAHHVVVQLMLVKKVLMVTEGAHPV
jgi:hypothetical protein